MNNFERAESEYYSHHAPYDDPKLYIFCDMCDAEAHDLCICDKKEE